MLLLSGNLTEESHNKLVTTTTKLKKNSLFCIDSSWVGKAGYSFRLSNQSDRRTPATSPIPEKVLQGHSVCHLSITL